MFMCTLYILSSELLCNLRKHLHVADLQKGEIISVVLISHWVLASRNHRILGKLTQDQSSPSVRFSQREGGTKKHV
jgi:hypothetical protein